MCFEHSGQQECVSWRFWCCGERSVRKKARRLCASAVRVFTHSGLPVLVSLYFGFANVLNENFAFFQIYSEKARCVNMLPEFLFTVGSSMQEISRDDFHLLNGANGCDKEMCLAVQRINTSPLPASLSQQTPNSEHDNHFDTHTTPTAASPLTGIKLEDTSAVDLFPTHATTWQQHPMNSHEHAHHRLTPHAQHNHHQPHHNYHHQHRFGVGASSKLLLQGSDDPLICSGANSVTTDDDQPLIAVVEQRQPQTHAEAPPMTLQRAPSQASPPQQQQKRPQNGCSSLTKQQLKMKAGLMSAQHQAQAQAQLQNTAATAATNKPRTPKPAKKKGVLKLRFHHQALPPEYLSHYEATQAQLAQRAKDTRDAAPATATSAGATTAVKISHTAKLPPPKSAHENVRSWLQKIAEIQRTAQQHKPAASAQSTPQQIVVAQAAVHGSKTQNDANNNHQPSRMQPQQTPSPKAAAAAYEQPTVIVHTPKMPQAASQEHVAPAAAKSTVSPAKCHSSHTQKRVVNYADLPYMGEITLDNSKPRRGRKPKKADICHLIYKNYGTIFPGTPKGVLSTETANPSGPDAKLKCSVTHLRVEEPLNLCLRDQTGDLYSISSGEDDDAPGSDSSACTTPTANTTISALDAATDTLLAANMKSSMPTLLDNEKLPVPKQEADKERSTPANSASPALPDISANSAAELLLHPVSVYYQKLIESGQLLPQNMQPFGLPIETIEKDNQLTLKIPIPSGLFVTPKLEKTSPAPSSNNTLEYPDPMSTPSSIKSEQSLSTNTTSNSASTNQQLAPQKRKRSAIFIPPIPAENTTNPATEVSICKFKFTGGAKPTLQEKKMLSVDSDGNYRYYSGTGDKSARGYEFFPRESLQQSAGLLPGVNCTGAFLNATGEKITQDIPPPSAGLSNELLQIPESPTGTLLLPHAAVGAEPTSPTPLTTPLTAYGSSINLPQAHCSRGTVHTANKNLWHTTVTDANAPEVRQSPRTQNSLAASSTCSSNHRHSSERKKKSRRSAHREKLEKTFKEKGFLIQTQQLESAEGATYCKFRQLKKFTRYLFRNWKDYLPDDLQQANAAAAAAAAAAAVALNKREGEEVPSEQQQSAIESILARHGFVGGNGGRPLKDAPAAVVLEQPMLEHTG